MDTSIVLKAPDNCRRNVAVIVSHSAFVRIHSLRHSKAFRKAIGNLIHELHTSDKIRKPWSSSEIISYLTINNAYSRLSASLFGSSYFIFNVSPLGLIPSRPDDDPTPPTNGGGAVILLTPYSEANFSAPKFASIFEFSEWNPIFTQADQSGHMNDVRSCHFMPEDRILAMTVIEALNEIAEDIYLSLLRNFFHFNSSYFKSARAEEPIYQGFDMDDGDDHVSIIDISPHAFGAIRQIAPLDNMIASFITDRSVHGACGLLIGFDNASCAAVTTRGAELEVFEMVSVNIVGSKGLLEILQHRHDRVRPPHRVSGLGREFELEALGHRRHRRGDALDVDTFGALRFRCSDRAGENFDALGSLAFIRGHLGDTDLDHAEQLEAEFINGLHTPLCIHLDGAVPQVWHAASQHRRPDELATNSVRFDA